MSIFTAYSSVQNCCQSAKWRKYKALITWKWCVIKSKYNWFSKQNIWLSRSSFHALLLKLPSGTFCTHCDIIATVNVQNLNPPPPKKKTSFGLCISWRNTYSNISTHTRTAIFQQDQRKPRFKDPQALFLLTTLSNIINMSSSSSSRNSHQHHSVRSSGRNGLQWNGSPTETSLPFIFVFFVHFIVLSAHGPLREPCKYGDVT